MGDGVGARSALLAGIALWLAACSAPVATLEPTPVLPEPPGLTDNTPGEPPPVIDDEAVPDERDDTDEFRYAPGKPLTIDAKMQARCRQYQPVVRAVAERAGLEPTLMLALAWVESGFNSQAISPAGAQGLMQLMPRTSAAFGCDEPWEPRCSVVAAATYYKRLLKQFKGNEVYALCAYHASSAQPMRNFRAGKLPTNLYYAERVLEAKARLDRHGCDGR